MKTLILDGSHPNDVIGGQISNVLQKKLQERGWDAEYILLREQKIGNCAGDFFCWVRSPGVCNINDDNRLIAAKVVHSDLLVYLTPVTFGGYSSALKCMVDHQIQNILPFFANVDGEIHHQKRYKGNPKLLVIGWMNLQPCTYGMVPGVRFIAGANALIVLVGLAGTVRRARRKATT